MNKQNLDPKGEAGKLKPPLALIPPESNLHHAKALALGAEKYGEYNWRANRIEAMTYLHAMKRHIDAFIDGEDIDSESGASHLGHVMAGCSILLDSLKHGTLEDNRPPHAVEISLNPVAIEALEKALREEVFKEEPLEPVIDGDNPISSMLQAKILEYKKLHGKDPTLMRINYSDFTHFAYEPVNAQFKESYLNFISRFKFNPEEIFYISGGIRVELLDTLTEKFDIDLQEEK